MNRKPIFDAVRKLLGRKLVQADVVALDRAIDRSVGSLPAGPPPAAAETTATKPSGRALGAAGARLIKKWEGCHKPRADGRFEAYPDPGSADGNPWTIGWGSTGKDIGKGTIWTQRQCDERFESDIRKYIDQVANAIGDAPTTANQFDALVCFHYNTGAIGSATLTRKHRQGRFNDAEAEFAKWIYNDRKPMKGLRNRRADEARLYATP
jgi:GH24 family phage-related lysozyme (muramidase)